MIIAESEAAREQAARIVGSGGVIAFRTDTFYGLGANPLNAAAVARIRELKRREENKPILLLISDENQIERFFAEHSPLLEALTARFWPGPLTIVGVARKELPEELTAGSATIGLRLPKDEHARNLVRSCGGALTATSANVSGKAAARNAQEVEGYFPTGIDLIIDAGEVSATKPSSVLDLSGTQPCVVREGAITKSELEVFLRADDETASGLNLI